MGRSNKHIMNREFNINKKAHPEFPNAMFLTDAIFSHYRNLLQNPIIMEDMTYQKYQDLLHECDIEKDKIINHHTLLKEKINESLSKEKNLNEKDPRNMYLRESFHSKLKFEKKDPDYSILGIEKFLATRLDFFLTSKEQIKELFDSESIDPEPYNTTFKDNTGSKRCDHTLLFNLAILLTKNKVSNTPLPYPILNPYINEFKESFINPDEKPQNGNEEFVNLYNKLTDFCEENLKQSQSKQGWSIFSDECLLFFCADRKCHTCDDYDSFFTKFIEYLKSERHFIRSIYKDQKYDFVKLFLGLIDCNPNANKEKWTTDIRKYYTNMINEYSSLRCRIESLSTELYNKYCEYIPMLLDEATCFDNMTINNTLQETTQFVLNVLANTSVTDSSLLFTRYTTIVGNLSDANNLYKLIELLYNICMPADDNLTVLATNIFIRESKLTVFEYSNISENELTDLLASCSCPCSLAALEDLMVFLSYYACDENDWKFVCSLVACQRTNPDWFNRFYAIIQSLRGASFKTYREVKSFLYD